MSTPNAATHYCTRCLATFEADPAWCANPSCTNERPAEGWGLILGPGAVFDRNYRVGRHLAVGGGGITYVGREIGPDDKDSGPQLAIKVLYAGRDQGSYLKRLANEARILQELDHPNIVECLGFVQRAGRAPYLVTRFESGGNLLEHVSAVGPLPLDVVVHIGRQICWALELAHSRGVIHRDMKPENILLAAEVVREVAPHVRVADFGIAKLQNNLGGSLTRVGAFVGTPAYAAPEQLRGEAPTPAADLFGLGSVLYFCATGAALVYVPEHLSWEDRADLLEVALPPRLPPGLGPPEWMIGLERALQAAMSADPTQRCTAEQLDAMLAAALVLDAGQAEPSSNDNDRSTLFFSRDTELLPPPAGTHQAVHARWQPPSAPVAPAPVVPAPLVAASARAGPTETAWFAATPPTPRPAAPTSSPASHSPAPPPTMIAALVVGGLLALGAAALFGLMAMRLVAR